MSYILDALRRADAERERGAVPNLHAQQFASLPDDDEPAARPKALLWVVAGLALALLAALAWNFFGREAPRPIAAPAPPASAVLPIAVRPASAAAMAAPASAVATAASAPPPAHARTSRDARTSTHTAASPARSARTRDERDANRDAASRRDPQRNAAPERNADRDAALERADRNAAPKRDANRDAAPARTDRDTDAAGRIYAQRDLPDAVRRELPGVKVSGSTYSSNSASRMLMINGLIFHEGDTVANGLVLQQIRPHGAVFAFRGYRYQIEF